MEQCGFTDSVEMEIKDGSLILSSRKVRDAIATYLETLEEITQDVNSRYVEIG